MHLFPNICIDQSIKKNFQPFNADLRHLVHRKHSVDCEIIGLNLEMTKCTKNTRLFAIKLNGKLLSLLRKSKLNIG